MITKEKVEENSFDVFCSSDFYYYNDEVGGYDWISDIKDFKSRGETKKFKTFAGAKRYFNKMLEEINETPNLNSGFNSVFIYDDISGEIYNAIHTVTNIEDFIPKVHEFEEYDDTSFSREQYKKFNVKWR